MSTLPAKKKCPSSNALSKVVVTSSTVTEAVTSRQAAVSSDATVRTPVVASMVVLSLLFTGGIVGVREGTLLCACCTGLVVKLCNKLFKAKVVAFLEK